MSVGSIFKIGHDVALDRKISNEYLSYHYKIIFKNYTI